MLWFLLCRAANSDNPYSLGTGVFLSTHSQRHLSSTPCSTDLAALRSLARSSERLFYTWGAKGSPLTNMGRCSLSREPLSTTCNIAHTTCFVKPFLPHRKVFFTNPPCQAFSGLLSPPAAQQSHAAQQQQQSQGGRFGVDLAPIAEDLSIICTIDDAVAG